MKYLTVKELKNALSALDDKAPVVVAPLNDNVKCVLNWSVIDDVKIDGDKGDEKNEATDDYNGNAFVFIPVLIDIKSNKELILTGE